MSLLKEIEIFLKDEEYKLIENKYLLINSDANLILNKLLNYNKGIYDFLLTDPPYNIGNLKENIIKIKGRTSFTNRFGDWDKDFTPEKYISYFKKLKKEEGNLAIFTGQKLFGKWFQLIDDNFEKANLFVWHKTNPAPQVRKKSFLFSVELIVFGWDKKHYWNFLTQKEMHNFFESPICMGKERLNRKSNCWHPTQKPLKLLKHLIRIACPKDGIILDPFMGVGSTGIAVKELNEQEGFDIKFIGIEINNNYYNCTNKRFLKGKN